MFCHPFFCRLLGHLVAVSSKLVNHDWVLMLVFAGQTAHLFIIYAETFIMIVFFDARFALQLGNCRTNYLTIEKKFRNA